MDNAGKVGFVDSILMGLGIGTKPMTTMLLRQILKNRGTDAATAYIDDKT